MAVELESTIMVEIGLGNNYRWFNGSGSCGGIRQSAVSKLPSAAVKHGLSISPRWLAHCNTADKVDQVDGQQYTLTNTWIACSYAIQDAIYRKEGDKGFDPPTGDDHWHFWSDKERNQWKSSQLNGTRNLIHSRWLELPPG